MDAVIIGGRIGGSRGSGGGNGTVTLGNNHRGCRSSMLINPLDGIVFFVGIR